MPSEIGTSARSRAVAASTMAHPPYAAAIAAMCRLGHSRRAGLRRLDIANSTLIGRSSPLAVKKDAAVQSSGGAYLRVTGIVNACWPVGITIHFNVDCELQLEF